MLTNILIIVASMCAAVLFLLGVARTSEIHSRKESNDFTGALVAVIGTTYAVLLAFMLSNVWNMFQQAQINAEQEANDVVNVFRIGTLLPDPARHQLQDAARQYAQNVVSDEFPAMRQDREPSDQLGPEDAMWNIASSLKPSSEEESQALSGLMGTLRSLTEHRRIRILQSEQELPGILWLVLVAGGVITVAASCFFGVSNFRFHVSQVIVLSFLISLMLVAIADIDRPYQGRQRVAPSGFQFALRTFDRNGK